METPQPQSPFELPPDAAARQQMRDTTKPPANQRNPMPIAGSREVLGKKLVRKGS